MIFIEGIQNEANRINLNYNPLSKEAREFRRRKRELEETLISTGSGDAIEWFKNSVIAEIATMRAQGEGKENPFYYSQEEGKRMSPSNIERMDKGFQLPPVRIQKVESSNGKDYLYVGYSARIETIPNTIPDQDNRTVALSQRIEIRVSRPKEAEVFYFMAGESTPRNVAALGEFQDLLMSRRDNERAIHFPVSLKWALHFARVYLNRTRKDGDYAGWVPDDCLGYYNLNELTQYNPARQQYRYPGFTREEVEESRVVDLLKGFIEGKRKEGDRSAVIMRQYAEDGPMDNYFLSWGLQQGNSWPDQKRALVIKVMAKKDSLTFFVADPDPIAVPSPDGDWRSWEATDGYGPYLHELKTEVLKPGSASLLELKIDEISKFAKNTNRYAQDNRNGWVPQSLRRRPVYDQPVKIIY